MSDARIFEKYGRAINALEEERANHRQTLQLLQAVLSGAADPARITFHENGWTLAPETLDIVGRYDANGKDPAA